MHKLSISITKIQHIEQLDFELDLDNPGIVAIVGKNGVGKTMLFKAIQNLITSNTFAKTSNSHIFKQDSQIEYKINDGEKNYRFSYNPEVQTLDYKGEVDSHIKDVTYVELPIPFGERFNQFQKLGRIDKDIRSSIITRRYETPTRLIKILNYVYDTDRFNNLIETTIKNKTYYAILQEGNYYIREDYLSSGEYFILNIYKRIQKRLYLIAIDEIDISLDAMAQVRFIEKLRELINEFNIKLLFSTHSLALLKTLKPKELVYMDIKGGVCEFEEKSYNYVKSLLYGFRDYDKYILTEDEMLDEFMRYLLRDEKVFAEYIIIYIGGASQVVSLMKRNIDSKIFDEGKNIISVLDGDTSNNTTYNTRSDILFLPFQSIEKDFFESFQQGIFGSYSRQQLQSYKLQGEETPKKVFKMFIRNKLKSKNEIFDFLINKKPNEVAIFKRDLLSFLNK